MTRKIKKGISAFLVVAMLFAIAIDACAAQRTVAVARYTQERSQWCWAACAQMIGKAVTYSAKSQSSICTKIFGTVKNTGATAAQTKTALAYTTGKTCKNTGLISNASVQTEINQDQPFIAGILWNSGGGHMVTVYGYSDSKVAIIDPESSATKGSRYYEYSKLKNGTQFYYSSATLTGAWTDTVYISG